MIFTKTKQTEKDIESAEDKVVETFGISLEDLRKRSRAPIYSHPRFALFFLLRHVYKLSYLLIAQQYDMHVSSVMTGIDRAIKLKLPTSLGIKIVENPVEKLVDKVLAEQGKPVDNVGKKKGPSGVVRKSPQAIHR